MSDAESFWPCEDCGTPTAPFETYMVFDYIWEQAGSVEGFLCVGCLERRIERALVPADFQPVPLNDDSELDSLRLRYAKQSGRQTGQLYVLAATAVELGVDASSAARELGLDVKHLEHWLARNHEFDHGEED